MYSLSALFLLAQEPLVRYPLWVVIGAPLAAACVAALSGLGATWITLSKTNVMQREKIKHEIHEAWRGERQKAYSVFFGLARDVAAARNVPSGENNVSSGAPVTSVTPEGLREAHATVELVGGTKKLVADAKKTL
jgi:hypothetical protein